MPKDAKLEKLRRIKVETPMGVRYLEYEAVDVKQLEEMRQAACTSICPYGEKICRATRDPRCPDDSTRCFMDFCSDLGTDESAGPREAELQNYIPVPQTIERNLGDVLPDFFQSSIKENPLVRLTDVIDSICQGTCAFYNEGKTECKSTNAFCCLGQLFVNKDYDGKLVDKLVKKKKNQVPEEETEAKEEVKDSSTTE